VGASGGYGGAAEQGSRESTTGVKESRVRNNGGWMGKGMSGGGVHAGVVGGIRSRMGSSSNSFPRSGCTRERITVITTLSNPTTGNLVAHLIK
jgi:hypothetical protein